MTKYIKSDIHSYLEERPSWLTLEREANQIRKKYNIPKNFPILGEVFKYNCGLTYIPQKTIDNLKEKSAIIAGTQVSVGIRSDKEKTIKVVSLSEFIKDKNVDNFGLLHLDVEGAEYDAILGADEAIKNKPVLLISIYHNDKDFFEIKPLIESWNLGYKFSIRTLCFRYSFQEIMLIGYVE